MNTKSLSLPMLESADEPIPRRSFLGQSVSLAALALLAGACSNVGSITGPSLDQDILVSLKDYPELASTGGVAKLKGVSPPIALANLGSGQYAALSLICPHAGSTVQWRESSFVCPNHGARFASDGEWTGGQPTSNLREYPTSYDAGAGTVTISPR